MAVKHIEPTTWAVSFSCPHCGAIAHQTWYDVFAGKLQERETPERSTPDLLDMLQSETTLPAESKAAWIEQVQRELRGEVFGVVTKRTLYDATKLTGVFASLCFSCNGLAVWVYDTIVYPAIQTADLTPNSDLTDDIQHDFREAAAILNASPRGAAALLRLCIQKLCIQLGEPGENLNADIASLVVKRGLDPHIQQALDTVRVGGNHMVHPGKLDSQDTRETALNLFGLVNEVANDLITKPARIKALYEKVVPESTRVAIAERDKPKR